MGQLLNLAINISGTCALNDMTSHQPKAEFLGFFYKPNFQESMKVCVSEKERDKNLVYLYALVMRTAFPSGTHSVLLGARVEVALSIGTSLSKQLRACFEGSTCDSRRHKTK